MLFAFLGFIAAVGCVVFFLSFQFMHSGASDESNEVIFEVAPGQGMNFVAQMLSEKGLVKNGWLFAQYARITGESPKLKRGEYSLNTNMNPDQILAVITSGKSIFRNLTFAEGLNIFDVAEILEKVGYGTAAENIELMLNKDFIKTLLGEDQPSLEGYLFPETYQVTKFDTVKDILTQMVGRFLVVWKDYENLAKLSGWTRHQTVIFASLVEKETGAKSDRPLVSSVFHNRLKKNMRLQTDPTVLYGVAMTQRKMPNNITKSDLLTPTPYNTYTNYGLPPTAISNPGKEAFEATFRPAQTEFLYFVSKNDGTTQFSESLNQHNNAVQTYQMNSKNREGKSWRNLQPPSVTKVVPPLKANPGPIIQKKEAKLPQPPTNKPLKEVKN